jgi:hypothetical protein
MATDVQLLELLRKLRSALSCGDIAGLRKLSSEATEATALEDGDDTFYIALSSYMLSKLIAKSRYWSAREKKRFLKATAAKVGKCERDVSAGRMRAYATGIRGIVSDMRRLESADARFVSGLESKSRVKLASKLYAQGFSLGKAASIAAAHKRDLLSYSGRTLIADRSGRTKPLSERLKSARRHFSPPESGVPGDWSWVC